MIRKKSVKLAALLFLCTLGGAVFYSNIAENPQSEMFLPQVESVSGEQDNAITQEAPPIESNHESDIKVGTKAPDFSLPNADGEQKKLSDFLTEGPVILSFYRGGWCPVCNDQLYAYQQILPEFEELGAQLVAVSPEKPQSAQDTASKNYITYEVLSDEGNKISRLYDLLWTVPEDKRAEFSQWLKGETGKTLSEFNGIDNYELPIPATFVIAQDGTVVYVFKDEDYTKRAKNEDIMTALKKLSEHTAE